MKQYYYINSLRETVGPMTQEELQAQRITASTLIWCEGMADWKPAGEVFVFVKPTPPPIPGALNNETLLQPPLPKVDYVSEKTVVAESSVPAEKPDNYQVWAIVTIVACCVPLGVLALIESNKVNTEWENGNYEKAQKASTQAKNYIIIGVCVTAVAIIAYLLIFVVSLAAEM